jgi:hypothetical protein
VMRSTASNEPEASSFFISIIGCGNCNVLTVSSISYQLWWFIRFIS